MYEPKEGLITFRAEGHNTKGRGGYSRVIHWPGNKLDCGDEPSGVTIGRGYDMGQRTYLEAYNELRKAGIPSDQAEEIAKGANLRRCAAMNFVKKNKHKIKEITESQQLQLFNNTYSRYIKDSERLYNIFILKEKDAVKWENLNPILRDVFVDMRYQGVMNRYRGLTFRRNNIREVVKAIKNDAGMMNYEEGRQRIAYLEAGDL